MGIAGYKYMITYIREKMDVLPKKTSCEQPTGDFRDSLAYTCKCYSAKWYSPSKTIVELRFQKSRFEKMMSFKWMTFRFQFLGLS